MTDALPPPDNLKTPVEIDRSRDRLAGILLVAGAATAFSMSTVMGKFAFDGGSDPVTVILARFVLGAVALAIIAWLGGRSFRLPPDRRIGVLLLGVAVASASLGYFMAIIRIPVSLAVLIFFTFPIMVGIIVRFTDNEPLTLPKIGALILAFAGIAVAVDVQFGTLDPWGMAFALVPAIAITAITVFGGAVMAGQSVPVMNFYMMIVGSALGGAALVLNGGPSWPAGTLGWIGFFGVPAAFIVGSLMYFSAFRRAKPLDMAMALNMEPVTTILFAITLLGEVLLPIQYAGAAMVVAAVVIMTLLRR